MKPQKDLIYDVGMNNGDDTAFYLACGYRVVAIDADPSLAAAAGKRFEKEIAAKKLTVLNVGIAEKNTTAEFWINDARPEWNSFDIKSVTRKQEAHHSITVQCKRLDDILAEHGVPHYLKVDIEGNDIICCNQLTETTKPTYVSVEMGQIELLLRLRDVGYDRFQLVRQFPLQYLPKEDPKLHEYALRKMKQVAQHGLEDRSFSSRVKRASASKVLQLAGAMGIWAAPTAYRSRLVPDWDFTMLSSGSFGEDLQGDWVSWEEASYMWHRDFFGYQNLGESVCIDLHATTSTGSPAPKSGA